MSVPGRSSSTEEAREAAERAAAKTAAEARAKDPAYQRARRRSARWEDATAWPFFVLSIVFIAANIAFFDAQGTDATLFLTAALLILGLWALFILDYVVRLAISPRKVEFVRRRWFELLAIVVPWLRPFVVVSFLWRLPVFRRNEDAIRSRFIVAVVAFALVFVYTGSATVYVAEAGDPRANITNLGDAIWWGFATITTVGYGDYAPVTLIGRTVAVLMMVGGVFVVGVTSAVVISLLMEQMQRLGYRVTAQIVADKGGTETVRLREATDSAATPDAADRAAPAVDDAPPPPSAA